MKKLISAFLLLVVVTAVGFSAPRPKIVINYVTPYTWKTTPSLIPDSTISQGMRVTPKGTWVYLSAKNFNDTTSITSSTWTILSKPTGSSASIITIPALGWVKFKADSTGTYSLKLSITTATGTKDTTENVYASTFVGTGGFQNIAAVYPNCMSCHAATPSFVTKFNNWKTSGHANRFRYNIDSAASYSTSCMKCHTVGYDHNAFISNGGFDDRARTLGWNWANWSPPKPGNWDSLKVKFPSLVAFAQIGCESCHGAGSEHVNGGGDTNKISLTVSPGKCAKCHDSPPNHNIYNQWRNALHSNPVMEGRAVDITQRNTFSDCNRCHDGEMYVGFTYGRALTPNTTTADQEPIGCASCHDPHNSTNEFQLRTRVAGSDTLAGGIHYNVGNAVVCLDCHKTRRNPVWYTLTRITSSTWGPHSSTQGDVILGKNAATFGVPFISGSHATISDLCVTCHMATTTDTGTVTRDKVGGHSLNLNYAPTNYDHVKGCLGCHPGKTSFDDFMAPADYDGNGLVESWQKEVAGCIRNLGHALPHWAGTYDSVKWQAIAADSNNVNLRKAYWNYLFIKNDKSLGMHNPFFAINVLLASVPYAVGIEQQQGAEIPKTFSISQNYPNPFNPSTKIEFEVPRPEFVSIKIYDIMGREIADLVHNQKMNPGKYSTSWFGLTQDGQKVASGVYFYRIVAGSFVVTKKMVMIK